ncbi:MAG: alginate lyase family protein, partial [Lacipirellulaceae bacterium]
MRFSLLAIFFAAALSTTSCQAVPAENAKPEPVYWELDQLAKIRGTVRGTTRESGPELEEQIDRLRKLADQSLARGPYSVTFKEEVPPSGDKHDYLSFSRYWWPDPAKPDGLPYIRHDGKVNNALRRRGDRDQIGKLSLSVEVYALAAYLFDEEKYANHAVKLIRTWFLDPKTKMNPHMKFGQGVPGRADGRGVG